MLWVLPTWLISLVITTLLGYYSHALKEKVELLEEALKAKVDKKPSEPEQPRSEIIDPLDEVQTAIYEHKKMMKRLNPDG